MPIKHETKKYCKALGSSFTYRTLNWLSALLCRVSQMSSPTLFTEPVTAIYHSKSHVSIATVIGGRQRSEADLAFIDRVVER